MKNLLIGLVSFSFFGCTTGVDLKSVDYHYLLNDGNSKVWIIDQLFVDGIDTSPAIKTNKELLIFYKDLTFYLTPLKDLGSLKPDKGYFTLNSNKRIMNLNFDDDRTWEFDIEYLTEDSIKINSQPTSELEANLILKPLPKY